MELGAIFVGLAMLVASVPFVIKPIQDKRFKRIQQPTIPSTPEENRHAVLSALRDLEFDFRTGKVGEEDYTPLRAQLVSEAATYIESEDSIADEQIEAMIAARRTARSNSQACSNCGHTVEADSRFCSQCGTAVAQGCPSCGKPVQDDDHFSTICGFKLEQKVEATA